MNRYTATAGVRAGMQEAEQTAAADGPREDGFSSHNVKPA